MYNIISLGVTSPHPGKATICGWKLSKQPSKRLCEFHAYYSIVECIKAEHVFDSN